MTRAVQLVLLAALLGLTACYPDATEPTCEWPQDFHPVLTAEGDTLGYLCVRGSAGVVIQ